MVASIKVRLPCHWTVHEIINGSTTCCAGWDLDQLISYGLRNSREKCWPLIRTVLRPKVARNKRKNTIIAHRNVSTKTSLVCRTHSHAMVVRAAWSVTIATGRLLIRQDSEVEANLGSTSPPLSPRNKMHMDRECGLTGIGAR